MKTIIYESKSKSINADKIITMDIIIEDEKGEDVILSHKEIKNITEISNNEDMLKICKVAYILCRVEGITEPICIFKSENVENVISEFVSIQYFLNQAEYTDINYDVDYSEGEVDDMVYFNQYFIWEN